MKSLSKVAVYSFSLIFGIGMLYNPAKAGWVGCLNESILWCVGNGYTPEIFICSDYGGGEEACIWCLDDGIIVGDRGCGGPGYASAPVCDQPECGGSNVGANGHSGMGGGAPSALSFLGLGSGGGVASLTGSSTNVNQSTAEYNVNINVPGTNTSMGYSSNRSQEKPATYTIDYKFLDATPIFASGYVVTFR